MLTSVDLPTPDEPTTATVWPTPHHSASAVAASGCLGLSDDHAQIGLEGRRLPLVLGGIVGRVGLGEEDHRRDPGVVGQRQIALEARGAEVGVARGDDEQRVDIGAGKLRRMTIAGAALEQRLAIQPAMEGMAMRIGKHPVADRELTGVGARRQNQRERTGLGDRGEARAMDGCDARGRELGLGRLNLIAEEGGPPEALEGQSAGVAGRGQDGFAGIVFGGLRCRLVFGLLWPSLPCARRS